MVTRCPGLDGKVEVLKQSWESSSEISDLYAFWLSLICFTFLADNNPQGSSVFRRDQNSGIWSYRWDFGKDGRTTSKAF